MTYFFFLISYSSHWSEVLEEKNKCLVYLSNKCCVKRGRRSILIWTCQILVSHASPATLPPRHPPTPHPPVLNLKVLICGHPFRCIVGISAALSGWAPLAHNAKAGQSLLSSWNDTRGPQSPRKRAGSRKAWPTGPVLPVTSPPWAWFCFMDRGGRFR